MAGCGACEILEVAWSGVAIRTKRPPVFMMARIDREILPVMVESGRCPCGLRMAGLAVGRKLGSSMVRVGCGIVIGKMATNAVVGNVGIIAVMAGLAGKGEMRPLDHIIIIVGRESGRFPSCCSRMAGGTGVGYVQGNMVRVGALRIIRCMACGAIGRGACEAVGMALSAGGCNMNSG